MPIEIKMPALSPTMEEGTLAKWLVKVGDSVAPGDVLAEIETDKATMEYEAVDEGTIANIAVEAGTEGVKVGTVIATLAEEGAAPAAAPAKPATKAAAPAQAATAPAAPAPAAPPPAPAPVAAPANSGTGQPRVFVTPLARRLAAERGIDLAGIQGSGPNGRIVRADIEAASPGKASAPAAAPAAPAAATPAAAPAAAAGTAALLDARIPHSIQPLSNMRKTIAKRLTQSMQQAPHIYLTVDVQLDRLLALRGELNAALAKEGLKLSVNDMLIKALGKALMQVPECNVTFAGDEMIRYERADISVAVSIPNGLITPIVQDANGRSLSSIAAVMKDLGQRAKDGKLQPAEYQGGTASISNMGMMGIKQFTAVINPPQSTILAVGAGEKRPWVMPDGSLGVAQAMTATGSFDHRAVDGADGARLMAAFRELVENPLALAV